MIAERGRVAEVVREVAALAVEAEAEAKARNAARKTWWTTALKAWLRQSRLLARMAEEANHKAMQACRGGGIWYTRRS